VQSPTIGAATGNKSPVSAPVDKDGNRSPAHAMRASAKKIFMNPQPKGAHSINVCSFSNANHCPCNPCTLLPMMGHYLSHIP
jgi:hypothetical protein